MAEANALPKIEAWIYTQLTTDDELTEIVSTRVKNGFAPTGTPTPYVIFAMRPGSYYVQGVGDVRLMTRAEFTIKLVTDGPPTTAQLVALDRFDEVIGKQSAAVLDDFVFSARGLYPVGYPEQFTGSAKFLVHSGSVYQIDAHPA